MLLFCLVAPAAFAAGTGQASSDAGADISAALNWDLSTLWEILLDAARQAVGEPVRLATQTITFLILSCTAGLIAGQSGWQKCIDAMAVLGFGAISLAGMMELVSQVGQTAQECQTYLIGFVPVYTAAAVAGGQTSGAAVYSTMFYAMSGFLSGAIRSILMPVMQIYFCFGVSAAVWGNAGVAEAAGLFAKCLSWLLKLCGTLFSFVLGLQNILAGSVDNAAIRMGRGVLSGAIPVRSFPVPGGPGRSDLLHGCIRPCAHLPCSQDGNTDGVVGGKFAGDKISAGHTGGDVLAYQIAAHHAPRKDHRKVGILDTGGCAHAAQGFSRTQKAVFADIFRGTAFRQELLTLVLQAGKTAVHSFHTGTGAHRLFTAGGQLADLDPGRKAKAQPYAQAIDSLPGIQVAGGAQACQLTVCITMEEVGGPAGHMENQQLPPEQIGSGGGKHGSRRVPLLMGGLDKRDATAQRKRSGCVDSHQKTGHVGTFRVPRPGRNAYGTNVGQICLGGDGLHELGQSGRMMEYGIALAQTELPGFYRQKLFAITNNLSGCGIKNRQRGCIVACIETEDQHDSPSGSGDRPFSRATDPSRPLTN